MFFEDNYELKQKLINCFVKNNQNKYEEIIEAIDSGDIELAHRLAHSLKNNAGQLNKNFLQNSAEEIEKNLKNGNNLVTFKQLENLKIELSAVLIELNQQVSAPFIAETAPLNIIEESELLIKLKPLLDTGNPECLKLIDKIRMINRNEDLITKLISQMENFDFNLAIQTLNEIGKR